MKPLVACVPRESRWATVSALAATLELRGELEVLAPDVLGRPRAKIGDTPLSLSLSHQAGLTAVACAASGRVGVDLVSLEALVGIDWTDLVPVEEQPAWERVPSGDRARTALLAWACREALLKALGLGLRMGLEAIGLEPCGTSFQIHRLPAGEPSAWNLELQPVPDVASGLWLALAWAS